MCVKAGPAHTPVKFGLPPAMRGMGAACLPVPCAAAGLGINTTTAINEATRTMPTVIILPFLRYFLFEFGAGTV